MLRRTFLAAAGVTLIAPALAARRRTAVVLGGGGPVGEAWMCGLLFGLHAHGIDLATADRIIGTSAGAIVGARLALHGASHLMDARVLASPESFGPSPPPGAPPPAPRDMAPFVAGLKAIHSAKCPACVVRSKLGSWALATPPLLPEEGFVESFVQRLPGTGWPHRFRCVAVDCATGRRKVWNASSGLAPARAIAASSAVPGLFAPVTIAGHRYMDGGLYSPTNADLARGFADVLVAAPTIGQRDAVGQIFETQIDREVARLRRSGSKVRLIAPDGGSLAAFGPDLGNSKFRVAAAEAGRNQAKIIADAW